jgi:polysaccharide chain length determinant protein (PEP-CTERM system associated)
MREQSEIYDVKFLKGFVRRRKRVFLIVSSIVFTASILFAVTYPKTYVSTATFLIEGHMSDEIVKGLSSGYIEERLQAITQQILGHGKLLEIAKEFNLYGELKSPADEENAVRAMRSDVSVRTIKAEDLDQRPSRARFSTVAFSLSFQGKDPETVQKVTSKLSSLYAEKNVQAKEQIASQTVSILEQKLTNLRERTGILERKLNDYKVAHAGELPEAIPFNYEQINRLNTQIDDLNTKIRTLEERSKNPEAIAGPSAADSATDPWTRLSQLRMQLVNLQTRYSDKHPDVIKTKNEIRQLEARLGISGDAGQGPGTVIDPTERELKRLTQQRAELQKRLSDYQRKSQMAPLVQKEYSRISSEYEDALKQYNETMGKLAEVKLARGLDQTQLGERFTLIEEPKVPQRQDKPMRMRILMAGLILSVFCGLFVSFTIENMDHSIKSVERLQKLTHVPVLTVVPYIDLQEAHGRGENANTFMGRLERFKMGIMNLLAAPKRR